MNNQTSEFLGLTYSWSKTSITLEGMQSLYGGVRVYLPGWTMSQMFVTQVMPGGQETKYQLPLGLREKDALCQLFVEQDFLTIQPEDRPGIPDEARPTITLTNSKREDHTVAKWAGIKDARFDVIYEVMISLAKRTKDHKPIPAKFKLWQKVLISDGLIVLLLLTLLLAYAMATALVSAWWPERVPLLLGLLFLLMIGAVIMVRWQIWQEREKSREDQLIPNFPVALIIAVLFFVAIIGCSEIVWAGLKTVWNDTSVIANDNVEQYAVLAYTSLIALYFLTAEVALIGSRFLDWVDERI